MFGVFEWQARPQHALTSYGGGLAVNRKSSAIDSESLCKLLGFKIQDRTEVLPVV